MPYDTYPYELPPLPYAYDALEPHIDTETMRYHHDKHFAAYTVNLNKALEPYPQLQKLTLEQLLSRPLPTAARESILHNGGGVYNHGKFFDGLAPASKAAQDRNETLSAMLDKTFGSMENFKKTFTQTAMDVFGSGWACLVMTRQGGLKIVTLHNQETVVPMHAAPIILFDVWEHAYYLKYKNERAKYVYNLWDVIITPKLHGK